MGLLGRVRLLAPFSVCVAVSAIAACGLDDSVVFQNNGGGGGGDASLGDSSLGSDGAPNESGGDGASSSVDGDSAPPARLVYGNTSADVFAYDIDAHTLTHVMTLNGCNPVDLAIDANGQFYGLQIIATPSIYRIGSDGTCSAQDMFAGGSDFASYIGARAAGTPFMVAVSDAHNNFYSIDSAANPMNQVKLQENFSGQSTVGDVACSPSGTCWSASNSADCAGAVTDSCLYSIPQDGSVAGTLVGKVSLIPVGLAYRGGNLYGFGIDGSIWMLTTTTPPTSTQLPVNAASGTSKPPAWSGAASFGNAD